MVLGGVGPALRGLVSLDQVLFAELVGFGDGDFDAERAVVETRWSLWREDADGAADGREGAACDLDRLVAGVVEVELVEDLAVLARPVQDLEGEVQVPGRCRPGLVSSRCR